MLYIKILSILGLGMYSTAKFPKGLCLHIMAFLSGLSFYLFNCQFCSISKGSGTIFKKRERLDAHKDFSTIDAGRLFELIER